LKPNRELYITDNIIIGMGELPAQRIRNKLCWVTPGGGRIHDRDEAIEYAKRLDAMIQQNVSAGKTNFFS
jgi:hypothetical protein